MDSEKQWKLRALKAEREAALLWAAVKLLLFFAVLACAIWRGI